MVTRRASPLVVAAGLVWRPGAVLLVQRRRADADHGAGRWELPGGKLEPGEHPRAALVRELPQQVVVVTHDLPLLADFDRVLVLDQGKIVADADPATAIDHYRALLS